ncbi:hypothetical protein ACOMHN_011677 [Nucella lapillus]
MRADVAIAMPTSSFKTSMSQLRLSLHDVKESEDEEEAGRPETKTRNNVSLAWSHSTADLNGELPDKPQVTKLKNRSQSAKRSTQNGHSNSARSDSPSSGKNSSSPHRPAPPKSAPSLRQRKPSSKSRSVKAKDQNGATNDSAEFPTSPASPPRGQTTRPDMSSSRRLSSRSTPRRRLKSRSEELSSSSGDPQSPRLSVSDHQQHGTSLSSEGSDDFGTRLLTVPGSPSGLGRGGPPSSPTSTKAWEVFEEHVRTIHDSSDMFSRYQGPSFQASSTFQETMVDLYGHPDYTRPPPGNSVQNVAARGMVVAGAANRFLRLRKRPTLNGGRMEGVVERVVVDKQTAENARRGWRVLKQYVQDNYTSKRTSQAALSWSMLRHTLKGLSDREKSRMDLYRRYGIVPTVTQDGQVVRVNTMLSERARQAIASGSRHPNLAHTLKTPHHHDPKTPHHPEPKTSTLPPSSPLHAAVSTPSLLSPRSSTDSSGSHQRRGGRGTVIRSACSDVRASVNETKLNGSSNGSGGGVGSSNGFLKNGTVRRSAELLTRSHTP